MVCVCVCVWLGMLNPFSLMSALLRLILVGLQKMRPVRADDVHV